MKARRALPSSHLILSFVSLISRHLIRNKLRQANLLESLE
jgi:hypothetical protein